MSENENKKTPEVKRKKSASPGILALRKVVEDVYTAAREAKKQGEPIGWSSSSCISRKSSCRYCCTTRWRSNV